MSDPLSSNPMSQKTGFTADWFSHNLPTWNAIVAPHLRQPKQQRVLEIGAFEGRASVWFLSNFSDLILDVLDPWEDVSVYTRFAANTKGYRDRMVVYRGKSQQELRYLSGGYDLIYVDGDHCAASVLHDAVLSFELLKVGGLLVFDDYAGGAGVAHAVDAFREIYGHRLKAEALGYQAIYRKMPA